MKLHKGKVYIVGAGPGDLGLITKKAQNIIESADVILYDELANQKLLDLARKDAEVLYVGKKAANHAVPQEDIEDLLIKYANEQKSVLRLKGGDPFIFGRGGEEAVKLCEAKIPYEIVPGVTSAVAAAAYAGIPLTHRGITSGFAVFTGHEEPAKKESALNWKAIAKLQTTLVFLMGMKNLPLITANLIEHGMDEETPVAVIHKGTTTEQKTVVGTLTSICDVVKKNNIDAPAIIVVGKVVNLREKLAWFEKKPLFGKKILVTRARKQASELSLRLKELGAEAIEFPTIEIVPNKDAYPKLDDAITNISRFSWIVFTSANAVEVFFERVLALGRDARIFGSSKVCAIGPATAGKLESFGIKADVIPDKFIAEDIARLLKGKISGKKILLPRSEIARKELTILLEKDGAIVTEIPIYTTKIPKVEPDKLAAILSDVDMVTFTSSSTAEHFAAIMSSPHAVSGDPASAKTGFRLKACRNDKLCAASIGPITSKAVKKNGIPIACEANEYTIQGLVAAITKYFKRTSA